MATMWMGWFVKQRLGELSWSRQVSVWWWDAPARVAEVVDGRRTEELGGGLEGIMCEGRETDVEEEDEG